MGIEAAIASFFVSAGATAATAAAIASAVVQIGASLLITAVLGGRQKQPKAQELKRELRQPTSEPAYRFVYGRTRATGTPVATPVVANKIWGCWLLNSRPSALDGTTKLFLDEREVAYTGDPFDLAGPGAQATDGYFEDHVWFWIGRGDQTQPPQKFLDEAPYSASDPDLWQASDRWEGRTVIWMELHAGGNENRPKRWPNTPPLVDLEGRWSKVWVPGGVNQDPDDPDTWVFKDNHALCVLDALRNNPIRPYRQVNLHMKSFRDAADAADEVVAKKDGSTEPRYVAAGTVTFDRGEIEDAINPLVLSGAANLIRIGGQLGLAPGVWQEPESRLTYMLGEGFTVPDMVPGSELVNELRVSYISPDRAYETAELQPWPIPGALAEDGGIPAVQDIELSFCPSATQAMRVRKILGLRMRRQQRIEGGELPPEAFDLVPGANVSVGFPGAYSAFDGIYEIEGLHPCLDPMGAEGVALRMPATMVLTGPEVYAYDPAADEEDVIDQEYVEPDRELRPLEITSITTGDAVNLGSGASVTPRARFAFGPHPSFAVSRYEFQTRVSGGDEGYGQSGFIDADVRDGNGDVYGYFVGEIEESYDLRVRAITYYGQASDWIESADITIPAPTLDIGLPAFTGSAVTASSISVSYRTPNNTLVEGIEIWGSDTDNSAAAELIGQTLYVGSNTEVTVDDTGLGSGVTRYYFARVRGPYDSASDFTDSVARTTT